MHLNISSIINKELQWNLTNEVLKKRLLGRKMKNIWSWNRIKEKHMTIFFFFIIKHDERSTMKIYVMEYGENLILLGKKQNIWNFGDNNNLLRKKKRK